MPTAAEETLELGVMGYEQPISGIYVYEQTSAFRTVGGRVGLHLIDFKQNRDAKWSFSGANVASVCVGP